MSDIADTAHTIALWQAKSFSHFDYQQKYMSLCILLRRDMVIGSHNPYLNSKLHLHFTNVTLDLIDK